MTGPDELDALTRIAEMRTILAKAGRRDLADLAWHQLCPRDVPLQVRYDALRMAGWQFTEPLLKSPGAIKVLMAAASLYGEQEWFPLSGENLQPGEDLVKMGLFEHRGRVEDGREYRVTRPGRLAAFDLEMPS